MSRRLRSIGHSLSRAASVLSAIALAGSSLIPVAQAEQPKLCFILPLSGGQAPFGESVRRGAELALEEAKSCVDSQPACALRGATFEFENHAGEPNRALSAVQKMLGSGNCAAFVIFGSPQSLAVADLLERAKKPTIALGSTDKIQSGRSYIFRSMPSSSEITKPLVEESARRKLNTIGSVSTQHDGMLANRDAFAAQRGASYIKQVAVNPDENDFRALSTQLHAANPDGIFVTLMPPQASLFAKQIRQLGYKGELFATNQVESPDEIRAAGNAFDGLWFAREGSKDSAQFYSSLARRYPDGSTTFAPLGYDAARILAFGLSTAAPADTIASLKDFPGALGRISTKPNRSFDGPMQLVVVRGGAVSPIY